MLLQNRLSRRCSFYPSLRKKRKKKIVQKANHQRLKKVRKAKRRPKSHWVLQDPNKARNGLRKSRRAKRRKMKTHSSRPRVRYLAIPARTKKTRRPNCLGRRKRMSSRLRPNQILALSLISRLISHHSQAQMTSRQILLQRISSAIVSILPPARASRHRVFQVPRLQEEMQRPTQRTRSSQRTIPLPNRQLQIIPF